MGDERMVVELPVLPHEAACPAALTTRGATDWDQGVVCRVMQESVETDAGLNMTAGDLGILRDTQGGVYLTLKSDPSSVTAFCHGRAIPVLAEDDEARASYTCCPTWQAEKLRIAEGREDLIVEAEPETVAMGVVSDDFEDPWAAARRGLDELAPKKAA